MKFSKNRGIIIIIILVITNKDPKGDTMIDKIIEVLKKHPTGLKAKDITRYISGTDRKSVNQILYSNSQIFVINNSYEWTLKDAKPVSIPTPLHHSKEVIKEYFPTTYICDECYDVLKSKSHSDLRMCQVRFAELSQEIPCTIYISQLVKTVLFVSNEEFSTIIKRTKRLKEIYKIRSHDEWERIILSEQFDNIYQQIKELKESEVFSHLITDCYHSKRWLEIVMLDKRKFKAFISRAKLLANIDEPLDDYRLSTYALDSELTSLSRLKKIIMLQQENNFPKLLDAGNQLFELLYISTSAFERCLSQAQKVYYQDGVLIKQIEKWFHEKDILQLLLLKEKEFNQLLENVFEYKSSKLIDSFIDEQKIEFFSVEHEIFLQALKNILNLEAAICDKCILPQTNEELLRCMWLSEKEFDDVMETKLIEKNEHDRICQSISETVSYYKNNPLRQCTGNCAICGRQDCPLDSK